MAGVAEESNYGRGCPQHQCTQVLKKLGVTAQREIEKAVRDADAKGNLSGTTLPAKAVVTVGGIDLKFEIDGDIDLA